MGKTIRFYVLKQIELASERNRLYQGTESDVSCDRREDRQGTHEEYVPVEATRDGPGSPAKESQEQCQIQRNIKLKQIKR